MASIALLGHTYVQLRQFEKAKEMLQLAVVLGPEYTNAYHGLVAACTNLGEKEEAKRYAEQLRTLKAKDEQAHRDRLKDESDIRRIKTCSAKLYVEIANEYLARGNPEVAEACLRRSRELDPESTLVYEVLSWLYLRQGRKEEALRAVEEMLARGEGNLRAQMRAGSVLEGLSDWQGAEEAYRKAIEITPELAGGYAALANLLLQQPSRVAEAQTLAEKAAELEPTARYLALLARASLSASDIRAAEEAIARAYALAPEDEEIRRIYRGMSFVD
jgi:tetratricopeptide (TPR) repeat protein